MALLERVSRLIRANLNDLVDKAEDHVAAVNAGNSIWEDRSSLWATMPEAGDAPSGFTLR